MENDPRLIQLTCKKTVLDWLMSVINSEVVACSKKIYFANLKAFSLPANTIMQLQQIAYFYSLLIQILLD